MTKVRIRDVADAAGVSVATVDRVLNRRSGVRSATIERVKAAVENLQYEPDRLAARLARAREYRFCFVLPTGTNAFMDHLRDEVASVGRRVAGDRVRIDIKLTDVFEPNALVGTLESLGDSFDGVALVALDHPAVREAINSLADRGVTVVTLVSDAPSARRAHYVGLDNTAAGRTAASILGRLLGDRAGKVGLIAGSLALRDHGERQLGFEQVLTRDFPHLRILPVREGLDDFERVRRLTTTLLTENPDVVGIYNVGAGNRGIVEALEAAGREHDVVFVAHELTPFSRRALISGAIDAVINQDAGHEARSAVRVLMAKADGSATVPGQERIRIDIFLKDNLP